MDINHHLLNKVLTFYSHLSNEMINEIKTFEFKPINKIKNHIFTVDHINWSCVHIDHLYSLRNISNLIEEKISFNFYFDIMNIN